MTEDSYLTEHQLAERLSIPVTTLRTWRAREAGPPFTKVGPRAVRYRWRDVVEYLNRRTVGNEVA